MTAELPLRGVVLAAGFGKRMAALTRLLPKPLLPIVNVPTLERILSALRDAGVRETLIVTGYKAEAVEAFCGDGSRWGMALSYVRQTEVSGTGSATRLAKPFVGNQSFILTYGDILLDHHEYASMARLFFSTSAVAASALNRMEDVSIGSAVFLDGNRITRMIEKPPPGTSASNLNNAGLYVFQPSVFDAIDGTPKSIRGEYELTEAVQALIARADLVVGRPIDGVQYDIGTPEAFLETNTSLIERLSGSPTNLVGMRDNFGSDQVVLKSPVAVDSGVVLERCHLGPSVCVGKNVRIGHGSALDHAVILPDADIGDTVSLSHVIIGAGVSLPNRFSAHGTPGSVVVIGADPT